MAKDNVDLICDIGELAGLFERSHSLNDFLQTVVSTIAYHMRAAVCSIYLYDEEQEELVLSANQGLNPEAIGRVRLKYGEGITGLAIKELRPICEGHGSRNPNFKYIPDIEEEKYEAFLAVPILRGLKRIAVLVVQDPQPDYFDYNDVKALRAIAAQLATSIENAKLLMDLHEVRGIEVEPVVPQASRFLRGKSGSRGFARGKAVILGTDVYDVLTASDDEDNPATLDDFYRALGETEEQLSELQRQTEEKMVDVASLIFSAHLLIVKDEEFTGAMAKFIKGGMSPQRAVTSVVNNYIGLFAKSSNPRLREKVQDLKDLGHRLLHNLMKAEHDHGDYNDQIIIARELLPSDILKYVAQHVEGLIIAHGSATSHISILARSLDVPLVFVDDPSLLKISEGTLILMDANQGTVFIDPSEEVIRNYDTLIESYRVTAESVVSAVTLTRDGTNIKLLCNINLISDLQVAKKFKAEGVGLYRSEFPFIVREDFPSEEEQYRIYRRIVDEMKDQEIIFRTLDIGGDKVLPYQEAMNEPNPFLGLRGIRFSLKNPHIFIQQLRAMLRAGAGRELKIMFPMIASLDDFMAAQKLVKTCIKNMSQEHIEHNNEPQLGLMIEVPSAVEIIDELAEAADFISVGTNDLVQYLLVADRTNERVNDFYISHHPAVLRALNKISAAAIRRDIEVSLCGNMAIDEKMIPFLLGIGIKKLSVEPHAIPGVQQFIRTVHIEDAHQAARKMLSFGTVEQVRKYLAAST